MSLTVPEAARRTGRTPETIRRWIREGRLPATKVGTQHVIAEVDLAAAIETSDSLKTPDAWRMTSWGDPMPDVVAAVRRSRIGH